MPTNGKAKKVYVLKVPVHVSQADIDGGVSCNAYKCMGKMAIARKLDQMYPAPGKGHKPRVDATGVKANINGYRWFAPFSTPAKPLLKNLRVYDQEKKRRAKGLGCSVKPFDFTLEFVRGSKIQKPKESTPALRRQINAAKKLRENKRMEQDVKNYSDHRVYRTIRQRLASVQI